MKLFIGLDVNQTSSTYLTLNGKPSLQLAVQLGEGCALLKLNNSSPVQRLLSKSLSD